MAKLTNNVLTLTGKSKKEYAFHIYPIDEECKDEGGIYLFTKRFKKDDGNFSHTFLYIGRAQSFLKRFYSHHKDDCIDKHGGNCLCLMKVDDEKLRETIEKDLLDNYNFPCNEVNN